MVGGWWVARWLINQHQNLPLKLLEPEQEEYMQEVYKTNTCFDC